MQQRERTDVEAAAYQHLTVYCSEVSVRLNYSRMPSVVTSCKYPVAFLQEPPPQFDSFVVFQVLRIKISHHAKFLHRESKVGQTYVGVVILICFRRHGNLQQSVGFCFLRSSQQEICILQATNAAETWQ